MGPHNADWTTLDHGVVHGIQGTLSYEGRDNVKSRCGRYHFAPKTP
jgi:hypothetical protein